MAEVFRPTYTITDPKTGKRVKRKSRTWHIRYYTPDGQRHRVKGYRDKKATENKAAELERRGIRVDAGLTDPSEEHARRPLTEHAEDFRRYLDAKGNTPEYVAKVLFRLTAVLDCCGFGRIVDVMPSAVLSFLAELRRDSQGEAGDVRGKSVKTANDYLAAIKGFTRWLWRDKRTAVDPLAGLSKLANGDTDVRHARRDFLPDELRRLLDTARQSPRVLRGLTGIDRQFLYLTACSTGLRASELASMTPESFDLDAETPTATVRASCTKNRRLAVQPLPPDAADALRGYLRDKPAGEAVWPGRWSVHAFFLVRSDLDAARAAWLETVQDASARAEMEQSDFLAYCDSEGRCTDFHALRHSFISMVGKSGASPKEHQDLARHSTYALTGHYTHSRLYDLAAAVRSLPIPTGNPDRADTALAATGTDGTGSKNLGPNLGPQPAKTGDFLRLAETMDTGLSPMENPAKQADDGVLQGSSAGRRKVQKRVSEGIRTPDIQSHSLAL